MLVGILQALNSKFQDFNIFFRFHPCIFSVKCGDFVSDGVCVLVSSILHAHL